jgi:D-threo-aldose 1-dehydrogenase
MLLGRYTLLDQSALDGLLPACQERGVSVIAAAVFHSGVLAQNRPGAGAMFGYRTAPSAVLDRASRIAEVCAAHRLTLPPAAIAFLLTHPARHRRCSRYAFRCGGPAECQLLCGGRTRSTVK